MSAKHDRQRQAMGDPANLGNQARSTEAAWLKYSVASSTTISAGHVNSFSDSEFCPTLCTYLYIYIAALHSTTSRDVMADTRDPPRSEGGGNKDQSERPKFESERSVLV